MGSSAPFSLSAESSNRQLNAELPSLLSNYIPMEPERPSRGRVTTFYSYKGGVGRSRALANVALQLAVRGNSVLCVDFDLEAPGLSYYFSGAGFAWTIDDPDAQPGLIDLFCSYRDSLFSRLPEPAMHWTDVVQTVQLSKRGASIDFIGPGRQDRDYKRRVCNFDWRSFYENWDGGLMIEELRQELSERYDYVLIDSRTGITDISGICTVHLPDILVAVFTPSPQSQRGLVDALESVESNRREMRPEERLHIVPLPCRVDRDVARESYDDWFAWLLDSYFAQKVMELGPTWSPHEYFRRVAIEHFSRFVYDDALESVEHHVDDEAGNAWKYRNLLRVIDSVGPIDMSGLRSEFDERLHERIPMVSLSTSIKQTER